MLVTCGEGEDNTSLTISALMSPRIAFSSRVNDRDYTIMRVHYKNANIAKIKTVTSFRDEKIEREELILNNKMCRENVIIFYRCRVFLFCLLHGRLCIQRHFCCYISKLYSLALLFYSLFLLVSIFSLSDWRCQPRNF